MQKIISKLNLNEIGSEVAIDIAKIEDRIPSSLLEQIRQDPNGKIIDYKMTDGGGIGIIIKFRNGKESWFFEKEVKQSKVINNEKGIYLSNELISKNNSIGHDKYFSKKKNISFLINPINFYNWLIYCTSDIT